MLVCFHAVANRRGESFRVLGPGLVEVLGVTIIDNFLQLVACEYSWIISDDECPIVTSISDSTRAEFLAWGRTAYFLADFDEITEGIFRIYNSIG